MRFVEALRLGCSAAALAAGSFGVAHATCSPNPPTPPVSTICTGVTNGQVTLTSPASSIDVVIDEGASLNAVSGDLAAFYLHSPTGVSGSVQVELQVDGWIDGGAAAGVLLRTNAGLPRSSPVFTIVVGDQGVVEGATAIKIDPASTFDYPVFLSLDNSGLVRSTSGPALVAGSPTRTAFAAVTNRAGGTIYGIDGFVTTLDNAGTIDGGAGPAYRIGANSLWGVSFSPSVMNIGSIVSNGAAGAISASLLAQPMTIDNSGSILNLGTGAALDLGGFTTIENRASGVIGTQGSTAIRGGVVSIVNRGLIDGGVVLSSAGSQGSIIDTVGGRINGDITFGGMNDSLTADRIDGAVMFGNGDDTLRLQGAIQLNGTAYGGAGADSALVDLTSAQTLDGSKLQEFETLMVTGSGALTLTGASRFTTIDYAGPTLNLAAGASLEAQTVRTDDAANSVTLAGAATGQFLLGGGDDVLRLTGAGSLSGSADGGGGLNRLELALGGSDAAPIALGTTAFTNFETLQLQSGVVSMAGDYVFGTISVSSGRLIGLAGSRLSGAVNIASGATFGTAGTVTGNVQVAGVLSPGASIGAMTVAGSVGFMPGSSAVFEVGVATADRLVVSGGVSVAPGSTLRLVGVRPVTPGVTLDLIVADEGISGAFTTVEGAAGLSLYLRQTGNRLQGTGLFTTDAAFPAQVSSVINALNTSFVDVTASAGLIAAMPAFVDATTGRSDPAMLVRLTPQAYASAMQLGVEKGLAVIDATRDQARFAPEERGLFAFGSGVGLRRTLDGDAAQGVYKGRLTTSGALGGFGFGSRGGWVGAFAGHLDSDQRIGGLGARTKLDGFVFGALGEVRLGGFSLAALIARDNADAETQRAVGPLAAAGDYGLKSWVGDVSVSYRTELNADWALSPRLGLSYVATKRDQLTEAQGGALALTVQGDGWTSWFGDARLELLGGQSTGARLHPFVSAGVRARFGDDDVIATARLADMTPAFQAEGLERDGALGTLGAGLVYDLGARLKVSAAYSGEFGDGGRQGGLVGLRWSF